jgi:asparagine synthase (glutamine-hydrolysing)
MRGELRPLVEDLLLSEPGISRGYFRPQRLQILAREHFAGSEQHTSQLWALLWLEMWHREFLR